MNLVKTNRCAHGYKAAVGCEICTLRARWEALKAKVEAKDEKMKELGDEVEGSVTHEYPKLLIGDCRETMAQIPDETVQTVITSPPYWGMRDYGTGTTGIGLEETVEAHLINICIVFEEVKRILRPDGTLWLNYGDRYNSSMSRGSFGDQAKEDRGYEGHGKQQPQLKMHAKNLMGLPWRVAFALQRAGWILRSDIIWAKPNPMPAPGSVRDRPTCAHEYMFLFSKEPRYFYDQDAVREIGPGTHSRGTRHKIDPSGMNAGDAWKDLPPTSNPAGRNKRTVWTIPTQPTPEAHFATFPERLVEPCILAGTSERGACVECGAPWVRVVERGALVPDSPEYKPRGNDKPDSIDKGFTPSCTCDTTATRPCIVFDPFFGSGTVGRVAEKHGRWWIGCELNEDYCEIAKKRTAQTSLLTRCH